MFTETGSKDWEYFTFPANVYAHLVPDADGICELVVKVRSPWYCCVFYDAHASVG